MLQRSIILILLVFICTSSFSQSRKKKSKKEKAQTEQPTSLEPFYPKETYAPKASKKSKGTSFEAEEKFYERREDVAKAYRKYDREMDKPQYSDPAYFGHKRMPKKRKPSKMKFCNECGIRH